MNSDSLLDDRQFFCRASPRSPEAPKRLRRRNLAAPNRGVGLSEGTKSTVARVMPRMAQLRYGGRNLGNSRRLSRQGLSAPQNPRDRRARRTATARPRDSRRYRPRRAAADPHRVRNDLSRGPAQNRRAGGVTAKLHHNWAIVSVYSCEIRRRDTPRNRQLKELRIPDLDLIKQAEQGCGKGLHLPTRSANFIAHPAVFVDDRNAGIFIWRKRRAARPKHPGPSALGRSSGASCCIFFCKKGGALVCDGFYRE